MDQKYFDFKALKLVVGIASEKRARIGDQFLGRHRTVPTQLCHRWPLLRVESESVLSQYSVVDVDDSSTGERH